MDSVRFGFVDELCKVAARKGGGVGPRLARLLRGRHRLSRRGLALTAMGAPASPLAATSLKGRRRKRPLTKEELAGLALQAGVFTTALRSGLKKGVATTDEAGRTRASRKRG